MQQLKAHIYWIRCTLVKQANYDKNILLQYTKIINA